MRSLASVGASLEGISRAVESALLKTGGKLALPEALEALRALPSLREIATDEILMALKEAPHLVVRFRAPDPPEVSLGRLLVRDAAKAILQRSESPLTLKNIVAKAQARFGADLTSWTLEEVRQHLTPDHGFYRLYRAAYGLRRHFLVSASEWREVREDCHRLLQGQKQPVPYSWLMLRTTLNWAYRANCYELGHILREDRRFVEVTPFHFALAGRRPR